MIRRLIPSLLILMTVVTIAKIGMPFLLDHDQQTQADVAVVDDLLKEEVTTANIEEPKQDKGITFEEDVWLNFAGQLLPSIEDAASMVLMEEAYAAPNDQDVLKSLRKMQDKLAEQERQLKERETLLKQAEKIATQRIQQLEQLEAQIQDLLQQEKRINDKKIKKLTAVYEGMKAQKAAAVIVNMELTTVVKMFTRMNEKQVGKILSFLPPKKAVQISQALTKKIGTLKK